MEIFEPSAAQIAQESMRDILDRLLSDKYEITENNERKKYTGKELVCRRLFQKAIKGDLRSIMCIQEIIGEKPIMQIEQYNIDVPQIIYNINTNGND